MYFPLLLAPKTNSGEEDNVKLDSTLDRRGLKFIYEIERNFFNFVNIN